MVLLNCLGSFLVAIEGKCGVETNFSEARWRRRDICCLMSAMLLDYIREVVLDACYDRDASHFF